MRNFAWFLVPFAALCLSAATPIATLSSIGPVNVGGVRMAADSVAFWPIASGDVISSLDQPVVLILRDQSRLSLSRQSSVRVDQEGRSVSVRVLAGTVDYDLTSPSSARFYVNDRTVPSSKQGNVAQPEVVGTGGGSRRTGATSPVKPTTPPSASPIY